MDKLKRFNMYQPPPCKEAGKRDQKRQHHLSPQNPVRHQGFNLNRKYAFSLPNIPSLF